jgi:hypothetical protein
MRKPSMLQANWIAKRLDETYQPIDVDDVYDVLLGTITTPKDFVSDVQQLAQEYEEDFRRNNDRTRTTNKG